MFEKDDFVQVESLERQQDGKIVCKWRNALYMGNHSGNHCVVYATGVCEELLGGRKIRKVE